MESIRSRARRFFSGLRLILLLAPDFVWIAISRMAKSTVNYWTESQQAVNDISAEYKSAVTHGRPKDFGPNLYRVCYALASFVYLLGWLVQAWITVEAVRFLISLIF